MNKKSTQAAEAGLHFHPTGLAPQCIEHYKRINARLSEGALSLEEAVFLAGQYHPSICRTLAPPPSVKNGPVVRARDRYNNRKSPLN